MAAVTIPNSFTAGTTIVAADMNANFAAIKTFVDGLETTVNGKANAAATGTQYTNTPQGKVGYAWSGTACDNSTTANCAVPAAWSYNAGGAGITSTRTGAGLYTVTFPGQNLGSGNVQVTAHGNTTNSCNVVSWFGGNVSLRCFTAAGTNADTQWTVLVTR